MRRLLALAAIYDGATRAGAAQIGGVTRQIVRDWVLRFNEGGPDGLTNRKAPGKAPLLGAGAREALAAVIQAGPMPGVDDVVRWRLVDLVQWVWETFGISISRQTLGRELRAMGSQAVGPSASPCAGGGSSRGFSKSFAEGSCPWAWCSRSVLG